MTPDKILTVIKEATNTFGNIAVKTTNDDMPRMNRMLLPILLNIPYDQVNITHNLSVLISPSAKYTAEYGTAFQSQTRPKPYIPTITTTMSDAERRKAEATHSARKEDYILNEADEMVLMRFLNRNVDGTWYRELENSEIFYTKGTAFKIMAHLQKRSWVRHAMDAVEIMPDMQQYFYEASIPVYINMMETAQKKAAREKLPISDYMLFAITTKAIPASDRLPRSTKVWE